eukprot:GHVU01203492.1.p2 GENE.GHVU01203492.1~~GHVU01203492.1.p2  ORF type:complete len:101 (-),score=5.77 GHVU01203492.1:267-569(-)
MDAQCAQTPVGAVGRSYCESGQPTGQTTSAAQSVFLRLGNLLVALLASRRIVVFGLHNLPLLSIVVVVGGSCPSLAPLFLFISVLTGAALPPSSTPPQNV